MRRVALAFVAILSLNPVLAAGPERTNFTPVEMERVLMQEFSIQTVALPTITGWIEVDYAPNWLTDFSNEVGERCTFLEDQNDPDFNWVGCGEYRLGFSKPEGQYTVLGRVVLSGTTAGCKDILRTTLGPRMPGLSAYLEPQFCGPAQ